KLPATVRTIGTRRNGQTIALADDIGNTLLVDLVTGKSTALPDEPDLTGCLRLVFSPDGETLAAVWYDPKVPSWGKCAIKLWDVASGQEIPGMPRDFGFCFELLFSPGGDTLVTVESFDTDQDKPVRVWRLSADRKRVSLVESLRTDQLRGALSGTLP